MESAISKNLSGEFGGKAHQEGVNRDAGACFHCGLAITTEHEFEVLIEGERRSMCCAGCQAVAGAIVAAGHESYYRLRTDVAATGRQLVPEELRNSEIFDLPDIQNRFVRALEAGQREASLILDGISCAACLWLIEQTLARQPGIMAVSVNYATQRALLQWDDRRIKLSEILLAVAKIGYRAAPFNPDQQQALHRRQQRQQQRRLAVAGLFGMQVMMLSISLYSGAWSGMERNFEQIFRGLSLVLTLPVLIFSARPFFNAAWRDLKQWRIAMDLPVSLAIAIAFLSSTVATLRGQGEIYFDSVVMFVFFLSASRYFESLARHRCAAAVEKLVQSLPLTATRLGASGEIEAAVAAARLDIGDRVLVRPGETVPADGKILVGHSAVDEALLTGESIPLDRHPGEPLLGGSINVTNPLQMQVTAVGADTVMAEIQRNIEHAQADKPPLVQLADRIAARFIAGLLLVVVGVAIYWWQQDPGRWFDIALAVLIVSCPCALSLATPTAISATLGKMQSAGLLVKHRSALEKMTRITHVVFDKTGTLTEGKPMLDSVVCAAGVESEHCLALAASLELHSAHPLAKALVRAADATELAPASQIVSIAGAGISARIDGCDYVIGNPEFVDRRSSGGVSRAWLDRIEQEAVTAVLLASSERVLAMFTFVDQIRPDARALITRLRQMNKTIILMTGDRYAAARQVACLNGIADFRAGLSPQAKLSAVQALQADSARVLMVGDGINDAPVLANADVSIAMAGASSLAKTNADIVLIANKLSAVATAIETAERNQQIIRQNMIWALGYNIGAIPAAAMGLIAPWLAALGMSLSSLLVVLNALRLTR